MTPGHQFYTTLDDVLKGTFAENCRLPQHVQTAPTGLPIEVFLQRQSRLSTIRSFFDITLRLFRDVVDGKCAPSLSRFLLNEVPESYGVEFHRQLPREIWTLPQFFRTDESKDGRIFEIQCPGSGWGDLQLLLNTYARLRPSEPLRRYHPSHAIAQEIIKLCDNPDPCVLHLLDNSSNPASMRYLMATTQPPLRYWGYEKSVRNDTCHFVRSHSFFGLVAENLFKRRVHDAAEGRIRFDLPPVLVFDQKAPLCLPFLEETRSLYSDAMRNMLIYSHPILENGFLDVDGEWVDIESFIKRPASRRRYFIKYAGCDVSVNWGSRSVFRLSNNKVAAHLKIATEGAKHGSFWLIQPEVSQKELITYFDKENGNEVQSKLTAKYSCYYSPTNLVGIKTMHRDHPKVHGQHDTVVGLAVPGYHDSSAFVSGK